MLDHFYELPHMTIQQAADLCFVSTASISRFVRYLGYSGFSEFKISCEKSIGIEADYSNEVKKAGKEDLLPIYSRFTEQVCKISKYRLKILMLNSSTGSVSG